MSERNEFIRIVASFKESLEKIKKKGIPIKSSVDFTDFKSTERKYILDMYKTQFKRLKSLANSADVPGGVKELLVSLKLEDIEGNLKIATELLSFKDVTIKEQKTKISIGRVPEQIREEVKADLAEMKKCFDNDCFRSCVILCGRIIEVCLHAKYYKETGFDILEKNPGIGLGKLIAKMDEKGIKLNPGLTQQIHLVNNVRIFSVHKKQRTFNPTKQQTEAIILFTTDVIAGLF